VTDDGQLDWLKLSLVPGLGPASTRLLIEHYGAPSAILAATPSELGAIGLKPAVIEGISRPDQQQLQLAIDWLGSSDACHMLTMDNPEYPPLLKSIPDAPAVLFVHGNIETLSQSQLAIVGSRNPSAQGRENAYEFAAYLAKTGLTITSGLALGIDGASHQGALDAGKQTIAVTGNGLDRVYPAQHRELAHQITKHGALVSEFPPGTRPLPGNFPRRNRIISGLSLGTLVVEAAQKSGSLITAYKALEQSREVFAIPGSIHNPLARGCHQLIRQGAKLVETADDILEELGPVARITELQASPVDETPGAQADHDEVHRTILQAMGYDPVTIDLLAKRTGLDISDISSVLLILELEGKISSQPGGYYIRNAET
jgi:DNA processing protein